MFKMLLNLAAKANVSKNPGSADPTISSSALRLCKQFMLCTAF